MHYGEIKNCDIANGEGVRISLFVSGCTNHCENCFQPQTWDFNYGTPFTKETEDELLRLLAPDYINGLTLLGGEPFEPENQRELVPFVEKVRKRYPQKNIWAFTGYIYDKDLIAGGRKHTPDTDRLLAAIDVLVDGPFIVEEKDLRLKFRGSRNQRVIDLKKTLESGTIKLFME